MHGIQHGSYAILTCIAVTFRRKAVIYVITITTTIVKIIVATTTTLTGTLDFMVII